MTGVERFARAALWLSVGALVASAHIAAAAWAMRHSVPPLPGAPEAIMIELSPAEPVAEPAAEPQAEAEAQPEAEPAPDFTPPPVVPLPPPDFASLMPPQMDPPRQRPDHIAERAAQQPPAPEPERRRETPKKPAPEPAKPRETRRAETPRRDAPRSDSRAETRSTRQGAQRGERQQGQQGARASAGQMQSWQQTAGARVSAHMARTRASGAKGAVSATVIVSVQGNGQASGRLARGTGNPRIDAALSRQAARMPRLPAPPNGQPFQFTQPITIQMR